MLKLNGAMSVSLGVVDDVVTTVISSERHPPKHTQLFIPFIEYVFPEVPILDMPEVVLENVTAPLKVQLLSAKTKPLPSERPIYVAPL